MLSSLCDLGYVPSVQLTLHVRVSAEVSWRQLAYGRSHSGTVLKENPAGQLSAIYLPNGLFNSSSENAMFVVAPSSRRILPAISAVVGARVLK